MSAHPDARAAQPHPLRRWSSNPRRLGLPCRLPLRRALAHAHRDPHCHSDSDGKATVAPQQQQTQTPTPTPSPTEPPQPVEDMVDIPAGPFTMGSDDGEPNESTAQTI
ncbi:MAG: hypothetical protein U0401_01745 [Anaerolineae bacterium]